MIHAFSPAGRALCGRRKVRRGETATRYLPGPTLGEQSLCPECRREVAAMCARLVDGLGG